MEENLGLLSVIIPAYNAERFIVNCVESVLAQTYKNIEVIIVNDNSTDHTGRICSELAAKYRQLKIINQKCGGPFSRNVGLKTASGEYIAFIDSDDYISPIMYETLINLLKKNNADIAICNRYRNINEKNDYENMDVEALGVHCYSGREATRHLLQETQYIKNTVWDKVYRKEVWKNLSFPQICHFEDAAVTYQLLYNSKKIVITEKQLYAYSIHEGSLTTSPWSYEKSECYYQVTEGCIEYFRSRNDVELEQAALYRHIQLGIESSEYMMRSNIIGQDEIQKLKKSVRNKYRLLNIERLGLSRKKTLKKKIEFVIFAISPKIFCKLKAVKNRWS